VEKMVPASYSEGIVTFFWGRMAELELNFLGEFEVLRSGRVQTLPPSKKTRALLAFLSLNSRRFRREYLCDLLWEVPDDPRGSLRWSLSKIRKLIDDKKRQRLIADRNFVELDTTDVSIDALELQSLVGRGLTDVAREQLECIASRFRGNFLEGLDLPNFYDFHSWCVAEREQVARAQALVLRELVERFSDQPDQALPHARALVRISPYDEESRASLIGLLATLGYLDEAEQQYQLGLRMLREVGVFPQGLMQAARRPAKPAPPPETPEPNPTPQVRETHPAVEPGSGLVGREREAETLVRLYQEVRELGKARFALVRGEPGIGKTRLIGAMVALARRESACVMTASAYESESIRPFALWIDAIHQADPAAFPDIFVDHAAGNRERLFDHLSDFIGTRSRSEPLVLVFDDFHWCDDSSAAAVHYAARMNRDRPVLGILATRDTDLRDNVAAQQAVSGLRHDGLLTEIELGPLSERDLQELLAARAPDLRTDELSRQCGGNPLLAIELARAEQEGDSSTSLTGLVAQRLARWGVDGTEVLQWAAVLSPHIEIEPLARLTGLDTGQIGGILEAAERQGMLTMTSQGLHFSHELLARAVYTTLSPLRRQVMHRKIADLLENSAALNLERASDLAHHATQSGDPGLAVRALISAGRLCLRFYANEDALSLVRRGMQLLDQLPDAERVCMTIDLHDIRLAAGPLEDWESSAREFAALAEQALDHGELAHARLGYHLAAAVRWAHGQWASAREESLQSERAVRGGRDEDHIIGMAETAKCLVMIERDLSRADAMLMEAQARSARMGFRHFAIPAALGMLRFHENKMEEAAEFLKESRTLCKSAGARFDEFQANEYLAMIEFQRGSYEQARDYCRTLEEIGAKLRVGSEAPFARALTALCEYAISDQDDGLDPALEELRVADAKHRLAYVLTRAAQLDCERGRIEAAQGRASEALDHATLLQRATEMALARAILACASQEAQDTAAAAEHIASIRELSAAGLAGWATPYLDMATDKVREASR
jgi:DNA-binding SARP family transcriptional activator